MDINELFSGLDVHLQKLLDQYAGQHKKEEEYELRLKELDLKVRNQKEIIDRLKKEIEIIKISGKLTEEEDNKNLKSKVNELLREIDHCIGLLNM